MTVLDPSFYGRTCVPEDPLPPPYGGALMQAFIPAAERPVLQTRLAQLPTISLSRAELHDLEMLGSGAYSPLAGFMGQAAYRSVLEHGTLPDGLPWGLPVVLAVADDMAQRLAPGGEAALVFNREFVGIMRVDEIYPAAPAMEARAIPGAGVDCQTRPWLAGGPTLLLASRAASWLHSRHRWPLELRKHIARHGWRHVGAIHVRHPWLRAHEYLLRCALETSDTLLLHAAIEDGSDASGPRGALAEANRLLFDKYFPDGRLLDNPMPRRFFASHPRAVLQHAILCQNYGCHSLFLPEERETVPATSSPDHGLAQAVLHKLAVRTVTLARAFHCEGCGGIATAKSCPHDGAQRIVFPEDDLHRRLLEGEHLPPTVARPEVARLLARSVSAGVRAGTPAADRRHLFPHAAEVSRELRETLAGHRACVLWMTGLSGSGKSTIAHRLERELLLAGHRAFVLDGDTLRHGLNRDLDFSEEARRENLRRAAEVAKVMCDAGLIVIASFISPFRAERDRAREIIGRDFREVHVEASLEECERRDPKGLYRRARAGQIPHFTGISSPYEPPPNPDIRLDTGSRSVDECVRQLLRALSEAGVVRRAEGMPVPAPDPWISSVAAVAVQQGEADRAHSRDEVRTASIHLNPKETRHGRM